MKKNHIIESILVEDSLVWKKEVLVQKPAFRLNNMQSKHPFLTILF